VYNPPDKDLIIQLNRVKAYFNYDDLSGLLSGTDTRLKDSILNIIFSKNKKA
jgi:hypothetical protein